MAGFVAPVILSLTRLGASVVSTRHVSLLHSHTYIYTTCYAACSLSPSFFSLIESRLRCTSPSSSSFTYHLCRGWEDGTFTSRSGLSGLAVLVVVVVVVWASSSSRDLSLSLSLLSLSTSFVSVYYNGFFWVLFLFASNFFFFFLLYFSLCCVAII